MYYSDANGFILPQIDDLNVESVADVQTPSMQTKRDKKYFKLHRLKGG